jgi:hypothetical protein
MRFALVVSSRCHEGKDQEEQSRAYRAIGGSGNAQHRVGGMARQDGDLPTSAGLLNQIRPADALQLTPAGPVAYDDYTGYDQRSTELLAMSLGPFTPSHAHGSEALEELPQHG